MWYEEYFNTVISPCLSYWSCLDMIFIPLTILGALIRLICLRPHDKVFSLPFEIPLQFIRIKTIFQNAIKRIKVYLQINPTTAVNSYTTRESITPSYINSYTIKESLHPLTLPPTPPSSSPSLIETPSSSSSSSSKTYNNNNPNKLIKELILKDEYLLYDCVQFPKYTGLIMIWLGKVYFGWRLNDHIFSIIKKLYWYFVIFDLFTSIIVLFKSISIEERIMEVEFGKKKWREFTNNKTKKKVIPFIF
ncbi:hypothetical protein RclHR1_03870006 [Rhizophagus clarus]|nr:hypothetical protein RclHR1_03870006 [Rhizophagus clarus]